MTDCPPGVHSMFDFCPGDCMEPVDETECVDGYPEHDFPPEGEGNECRRCGAEAEA